MNVPAARVVHVLVDAFTADWSWYTVQLNLEDIGPMTLILHVRDSPASAGAIVHEDTKEVILKREEYNTKPSDKVIHATAHPSIILPRRTVPGTQIQGYIPPIHTYWIRHADKDDFERRGAKLETTEKENIPIAKRRKL